MRYVDDCYGFFLHRSLDEEVACGRSGWPPRLFKEVDFKRFLAILSGVLLTSSEFESLLSMDRS